MPPSVRGHTLNSTSQAVLRQHPQLRLSLNLAISLTALISSLILAINIGAADYSLQDAFEIFKHKLSGAALTEPLELAETILFSIRIPRVLVAALCGGALAVAGVISQGLFRNNLASPSVLGTEAGGAAAAAFVFYAGVAYLNWFFLPLAAFIGALVATSFLFYLASRYQNIPMESLLLAGFAINALLGAGTSLCLSLMLEDYQKAGAVMHWLLGGFSSKGWEHFLMGLPPGLIGFAFAYRLAPQLDILSLGEEIAHTLSINIKTLRHTAIITIALLVGASVSIAGAIPFVGLLVPHLTRLLAGPKHRPLLILSALNGMTLVVLADIAARTLRAPQEFEVGILTSLLGAPFFIWLLIRDR